MPRTLEVSAYRMCPLAEVGLVHWCAQEDMARLPFLSFLKGGRRCLHNILQVKLFQLIKIIHCTALKLDTELDKFSVDIFKNLPLFE